MPLGTGPVPAQAPKGTTENQAGGAWNSSSGTENSRSLEGVEPALLVALPVERVHLSAARPGLISLAGRPPAASDRAAVSQPDGSHLRLALWRWGLLAADGSPASPFVGAAAGLGVHASPHVSCHRPDAVS